MVLTAYGALSPAIGLSCHRRQRGVSGQFGPTSPFRRLDASVETSGPRAFAVRTWRRSSDDARSVHRIPPRVRDDAYAPLVEAGRRESIKLFLPNGEANYFSRKGWTGQITLKCHKDLIFARSRYWTFGRLSGRSKAKKRSEQLGDLLIRAVWLDDRPGWLILPPG
jgi:hypothetical protein